MKSFDKEIVSGSLLRSVWKLAWPLVLLNLVNGAHGVVDHVLVGRFVESADNAANAAIGVAWQVFLVVVVFVASIFHGTNVLIARYAGREDRETLSEVFHSSLLCAVFVLFFVVAPLGWLAAPRLLDFVEAGPSVRVHALPYLRILFACGAPLFLMFMLTGAFNASGDPTTPLKLGVLTTLLNVAISIMLITGAGPFPALGTLGAALGTVMAPAVSVAIGFWLIHRRSMIIQPPRRWRLLPDPAIIVLVARIGLPTGVQGVLLNIGGVFLLRYIGMLENGPAAQAAYTICYAQLFSLVAWTAFGLRSAAGTLMGQNIGAGDPARGKAAVGVTAVIGSLWAVFVGVLFWTVPGPLLDLFNAVDEPLRGYGVSLLHHLSFAGVALAATLALTGGLQGAGETKLPMCIAFVTQIVILVGVCQALAWAGMLTPRAIWMTLVATQTARFLLTWAVFRTERWTRLRIELPVAAEPTE